MSLRNDAQVIIDRALKSAMPDTAVRKALAELVPGKGKLVLVAAGKAAWQMANAAVQYLGNGAVSSGVVITKYDHVMGEIPGVRCFEAGHPVPDENSFAATNAALELVSDLCEDDTVLFLLSGGGSALFEKPLVSAEELSDITRQLLACGADIVEMNTVRKRLSAVKGGKFAQVCAPARVFSIVLSDILGDPLDMIASGPAYPDSSTCEMSDAIVKKYGIQLSDKATRLLWTETPKELHNVDTRITGSVRQLCAAAKEACDELGYRPTVLTSRLCCTARDAGSFLGTIAAEYANTDHSLAFIAGGETVVHLTGTGLGGRNQELALAAAPHIGELSDVAVFSFGSDGTDGPTDAAGGYVDNTTAARLLAMGVDIPSVLMDNDSYHALEKCEGLIITGPTGTNVNDLSVVLIKR